MKTCRSIGKVCLKYCVLNVVLTALMLATAILPNIKPAMADVRSDIVERFSNVTTNSSNHNNGNSQPADSNGQNVVNDSIPPMTVTSSTPEEHVPVPGANLNAEQTSTDTAPTYTIASFNVTPSEDVDISLNSSTGTVKLHMPKGAVNQGAQVDIIDHGAQSMGMVSVLEFHAYPQNSIQGTNASGEIQQFNTGLTLSIQNTPAELAGLDTDTLKLYYLDENTSQWVPVPDCSFDPETYVLTANISHFSFYGENADPIISGPGDVLSFQTNLHSGSATYSYPLEVPPGSGGLQPSINLIYNSASVDEMKNKKDVGSWVGIGWSLGLGSVKYDLENDEYLISFDGASYSKLVSDGNGIYHTIPESFYKITNNGQQWDAYDTNGTHYRFGGTNDSRQYYYNTSYRWDLSYIQDVNSGNSINVSYVQDAWPLCRDKSGNPVPCPESFIRSAYPQHIKYNNGSVDIQFNSSYSSLDPTYGPYRLDNPQYSAVVENRQLDFIDIKVDGILVREYVFNYSTTQDYYSSDYGGTWYAGTHILNSVTENGSDGITQLPATAFSYVNESISYCDPEYIPDYDPRTRTYSGNPGNPAWLTWPYLARATNGYGATVNYTYSERSLPWDESQIEGASGLTSTWSAAPNDFYASSFDGKIWHYNENSSVEVYAGNSTTLQDMSNVNVSGGLAVGDGGTILLSNGNTFTQVASGTTKNLMGVYGTYWSGYIVGGGGTILRYNYGYLSTMTSPSTEDLYDVWNGYAVGTSGTILTLAGANWQAMSSTTTQDLYGVWGSSSTDVFAVGAGGTILHYDGSSWSSMDSGVDDKTLFRVWGTSSTDVYAVGITDIILHYNGKCWTTLDSGTSGAWLMGVHGTSNYGINVVGATQEGNSLVLHYPCVDNVWSRQVVTEMTLDPGIGSQQTYSYTYTGDPQYFRKGPGSHAWDDEFRGFPQVRVTDSEGNYTDHYFWTTGNGDAEILTGREYLTESYDSAGQLLSKQEFTWAYSFNDSQPTAPGANIAGYWKCDENSGQTVNDSSGSGNTGTLGQTSGAEASDPVWTSGGRYQAALAYDGSDDYVNIGNGSSLNLTGNFSMEAWVKRDSLATRDCILAAGIGLNNDSNSHQWLLYVDNSDLNNRICFEMGTSTPRSYLFFSLYGDSNGANASINDSSWHHVAVTFNKTASNAYQGRIYLDGIKRAEGTGTGSLLPITTGITDRRIGSRSAGGDYFHGTIDDVRIYSRVLSPEEIQQQAIFSLPFVYLKEQSETIGSKTSTTRYVYDGYGNMVTQYNDGDISTSNDDSTIQRVFYPNVSANMLNKPARERVYATITGDVGGANLKSETDYYYDGNNANYATPPSKGNPTRVEQKIGNSSSVSNYYTYDIYGNKLTQQDPNGNVWQTAYETTYHTYPLNISSPISGQSEIYAFDPGTGNLLSRTDVNNQSTSYQYDVFGRNIKVIKPGDNSSSPSVQYQYNNWGNLSKQHLETLTKTNASDYLWSSQYFDGFGRVIQTQARGEEGYIIIDSTTSYNSRGLENRTYVSQNLSCMLGDIDQDGLVTLDDKALLIAYLLGRVQFTEVQRRLADVNCDGSINTTDLSYIKAIIDGTYLPSGVNGYVVPDSSWKYSSSIYDALGRVTVSTAADGTNTSTDYSTPWQQTVTNPLGYKHVYYYDAFNRLIRVDELNASPSVYATTNYSYDTLGNLVQVTDANNNITTMNYDWLGRKTSMSDPDMGNWSYSYDASGNLVGQTDAKGQMVTLTYDALNRITAKRYPAGSGMTNVSYTYDSTAGGNYGKGRITGVTDAAGNTSNIYDARGRIIQVKKIIDGTTYTTSSSYDAADRVTAITYPTGEVVTQTYNGRGLPNTLNGSVAGNLVTSTTYNQLAQVTRINLGNGDFDTYAYYGLDAGAPSGYWGKLWQINTSNTSTTLRSVRYTWDANGNMVQRQDALTGETEIFGYDFLDRLTSASGAYSESYTYNKIGNILSKNGVAYTYGSKPHAVTQVGETTYVYDANGNMITRGTQTIIYDMANMPTTVTTSTIIPQTAWSAMTSGTTVQLNGVWGSNASNIFAVGASGTIRRYNGSAWSTSTSGTTVQLKSIWGSNASNVFAVGASGTIRKYNGTSWSAMTSGITGLFPPSLNGVWGSSASNVFAVGASGTILKYNGTSWSKMTSGITVQLNSVWGSNASNVFAVGASGNIRRYNGSAWSTMTSGTTQNLWAVWGTASNDVFAAGANGVVLHYNGSAWNTMSNSATAILYGVWGSSGDNVFAAGASGTIRRCKSTIQQSVSTFVYDGNGNRIKKTEGGETTIYVNQYYEKNITTNETTTHYYSGGKEVAYRINSSLRYVHQDSLGSTSLTTSSSGAVVASIKYFPFGVCRNSQGNLDTDKLFTGQRLDDTGLYYYNARYYDATIGRFISPDTMIQDPSNPQTLNRYSYCLNNPLKYTDPSGHDSEYPVIGADGQPIPGASQSGPGAEESSGGYHFVSDANGDPIEGAWQYGPGAGEGWVPLFTSEGHLVPGGFYNTVTGEQHLPPQSWWSSHGKWVIIGVVSVLAVGTGCIMMGAGAWLGCSETAAVCGIEIDTTDIFTVAGSTFASWEHTMTPWVIGGLGFGIMTTIPATAIYYGGIKGGISTSPSYDPYPTFESSVSLVSSYVLYQQYVISQNMENGLRGLPYVN